MNPMLPILAMLALMAVPARAEDAAALASRAPAIALDGPVVPMGAPVEIGTTGWAAFRRLCVAQMLLRPDDGMEVATSPQSCLAVEQARQDGDSWHLTLRAEMNGRGPDITMSIDRDAQGRFGPARVIPPAGAPPLDAAQEARLSAVFQAALQAHGLQRAVLAPRTPFIMPLPLGAVDTDIRVEGGGFACVADSEGVLRGRRVIPAACHARAVGEVSPGRAMHLSIAGHFAIDVATGMVLQHGYASFLVMDADPRGSMARTEMRGVSRMTLQ